MSLDVDAPDFSQSSLALSGLVFELPAHGYSVMDWTLTSLLPATPTTSRQFAGGQRASVFARLYASPAARPVSLSWQVISADDRAVASAAGLSPAGNGDVRIELPTSRLTPGEYLLDVRATSSGASAERSVRFTIR